MSNSKRRCTVCRDYFPAEDMIVLGGVTAYCQDDFGAAASVRTATRPTKKKRKPRRGSFKKNGAPPELKRHVRMRDSHRCRFCNLPSSHLEVHHIKYLSEGGPNHPANLITLCDEHHRLVHSDKKKWQPVLLGCIWVQYVGWAGERPRRLTVGRMFDRLMAEGLHPYGEHIER